MPTLYVFTLKEKITEEIKLDNIPCSQKHRFPINSLDKCTQNSNIEELNASFSKNKYLIKQETCVYSELSCMIGNIPSKNVLYFKNQVALVVIARNNII